MVVSLLTSVGLLTLNTHPTLAKLANHFATHETVYPSTTEEFDVKLPQTVASLTEIWASDGESQFLVAISFWDRTRHHIISVCTEGDSAELMTQQELRQRTDDMVFSYGNLSHRLYTSPFEIKETAMI